VLPKSPAGLKVGRGVSAAPPEVVQGANSLPDGEGGGAERVVPGHSGRDWAAEIARNGIRMKEKVKGPHENNGKHRRGVFSSGRKRAWEDKTASKHPLCRRKPRAEWKKDLQTYCDGRESRKRPMLVVGKKPNGKSRLKQNTWKRKLRKQIAQLPDVDAAGAIEMPNEPQMLIVAVKK
jgi:hypothetical protein